MNKSRKLTLLVLSCDGYSDLWDDFFNLRDKYWADCPYEWYLVTETKEYKRENVNLFLCGEGLNWAGRLRKALKEIDSDYFGLYLEDFFLEDYVDNEVIASILNTMQEHDVKFINTSDVFYTLINMKNKEYLCDHLIIIPDEKPYGLSAEAAIWNKDFLLKKLGEGDYSAWKFEDDRVAEAKSGVKLGGLCLCDDRMPFHASIKPVVIAGRVFPPAKRFFKKKGYTFLTQRESMNTIQVILYRLKQKLVNIKYGKKQLKWIASTFFDMRFT